MQFKRAQGKVFHQRPWRKKVPGTPSWRNSANVSTVTPDRKHQDSAADFFIRRDSHPAKSSYDRTQGPQRHVQKSLGQSYINREEYGWSYYTIIRQHVILYYIRFFSGSFGAPWRDVSRGDYGVLWVLYKRSGALGLGLRLLFCVLFVRVSDLALVVCWRDFILFLFGFLVGFHTCSMLKCSCKGSIGFV